MKKIIIISILFISVSLSCNKIFQKDLSLTPKEYQRMGMPSGNKLSSVSDYIDVIKALYKVRTKNPLSFPRKNSKKSGDVFNLLINKENLSFVNDTSISLRDKAMQIQSFSSLQNSEIQLYTDKLNSKQYYNKELIELYIYGLLVRDKMFELAGEINNSNSETDISMQQGQKVVVLGYVSLIKFLLDEQLKSGVYHSKDLYRLSSAVTLSATQNLKWIEPTELHKISIKIQNIIVKSTSGSVKRNYNDLLKLLNNIDR